MYAEYASLITGIPANSVSHARYVIADITI